MKIVFEKTQRPLRVRPRRKKPQFSKVWLVSCIVLSIMVTAVSFLLSAVDKNPVSELSVAIIEALWGTSGVSFIGYALQNCMRAYTASKFGIPKEDIKDADK